MKKNLLKNFGIRQAFNYLEKNPEENIPKLVNMLEKSYSGETFQKQIAIIKKAVEEKNNWYQLMMKMYELDPGVRKAVFENLLLNGSIDGYAYQQEMSKKYNCNIPWAILGMQSSLHRLLGG